MAWVAIGGAVAGSVINGVMGRGSNGASPTSGSPAARAADPFSDQRAQYQTQLQALMGASGMNSGSQSAQQGQQDIVGGVNTAAHNANTNFNSMSAMLQPGNNFQASDPSYQWRLSQGTENLARQQAAQGRGVSGGAQAELLAYGQGMASQEFGAEFGRLQSAGASESTLAAQQFGEYGTIDTNQQNIFQNNYSRLAQLSGANTGAPGQAGQILQNQQAGAAAQAQQWGTMAINAGKQLWGNANQPSTNPNPDYMDTPVVQPDPSQEMPSYGTGEFYA